MSDNHKRRETPHFQTTQWSLILAAGRDDAEGTQALHTWCALHVRPLTTLFRIILSEAGANPDDADELAQEFLLRVLKQNPLRNVKKEGGRFRTWITTVARNFYRNRREAERAAFRGGNKVHVPLDETLLAEAEPDPELGRVQRSFDRQWAADLLTNVLETLRTEFLRNAQHRAKKEQLFEALRPYLATEKPPYRDLAATLGCPEVTLRGNYHRLFEQFREVLCRVVTATIEDPADLKDEIRHLLEVLATPARDKP